MKKLLNISDLKKQDFFDIITLAKDIDPENDISLKNKNIGLIFEKNSTRTRLSFQVGIRQMNGNYLDIKLEELNLQRVESFEDTFEIFSCYLDALVYRTNDHNKLELALKYFKKPIINALSDLSHPCQAISDIFTLQEHFQREDNFNIVWLGDLNNVLFSLMQTIGFLEKTNLYIFTDEKIYENNKKSLPTNANIFYEFEINDKVLKSADCIMTDVYNSMNDEEDKESILNKFQVNQYLLDKTTDKAVFMHCLPAKIGSEVTLDVLKGSKSITLNQAKNRLVAQRGIMKWLGL